MPELKKKYLLLLSLATALLLSAAWPLRGIPFISFIALIPLLFVWDQIAQNPQRFRRLATFRYSYVAFVVWNALTTYWIWNSTALGALFAILVNSLLMALVVQFGSFIRQNLNKKIIGLAVYPVLWITFEFLHLDWDLSWTWLTLGNVFASKISWIQWYEFTGVNGGSLWIWLINIMLFVILKSFIQKDFMCKKARVALISGTALLLIVPSVWSQIRYNNYEEKINPVSIVLIQPNLDPYSEQYPQYHVLDVPQVVDRLLVPTAAKADTAVDFYVTPESVLQEDMFEDQFAFSYSLNKIRAFLKQYAPDSKFIVGGGTFRLFAPGEPLGPSARRLNSKQYYEAFNTAMFMDTTGVRETYHKSKLVAGVEQMPFSDLIKPIEKLAIDLGGTVGTLGKSKDRTVYTEGKVPVSTVICYESVYGGFVADFINNGAQLLFIMTNDGWWGETAGHRQHFKYASLRAVETRRSIARAANTGISCFINQRGDVIQQTDYWTRDVIKNTLNANDEITFYVKHGDYIGRAFTVVSGLLLLLAFVFYFIRRINKRREKQPA